VSAKVQRKGGSGRGILESLVGHFYRFLCFLHIYLSFLLSFLQNYKASL